MIPQEYLLNQKNEKNLLNHLYRKNEFFKNNIFIGHIKLPKKIIKRNVNELGNLIKKIIMSFEKKEITKSESQKKIVYLNLRERK